MLLLDAQACSDLVKVGVEGGFEVLQLLRALFRGATKGVGFEPGVSGFVLGVLHDVVSFVERVVVDALRFELGGTKERLDLGFGGGAQRLHLLQGRGELALPGFAGVFESLKADRARLGKGGLEGFTGAAVGELGERFRAGRFIPGPQPLDEVASALFWVLLTV